MTQSPRERAIDSAHKAYNNGLEKGAFRFDAARFNLALSAYMDSIAADAEMVEAIGMAIAAHKYKDDSYFQEIFQDSGLYAAQCWEFYKDEAKAILSALKQAAGKD